MTCADKLFGSRAYRTTKMWANAGKDLHVFAFSDYPHRTLRLELPPSSVLRNDDVLLDQLALGEFIERTEVGPILLVRGRKRRGDRKPPNRHAQPGRNAGDDQPADQAQK